MNFSDENCESAAVDLDISANNIIDKTIMVILLIY